MAHQMGWALAVATTVGFLGWLADAARRGHLRVALRGQGRRPLVVGFAVGVGLAFPAALLLHRLPVSVNLSATGGFLAVAAASFVVLDRGYVPSVIATGVPIALLRFSSRGCGDTPSGMAAVCIPTPPGVAAIQAVAGALAVSALGYVVGRSALLVHRSVAPRSPVT